MTSPAQDFFEGPKPETQASVRPSRLASQYVDLMRQAFNHSASRRGDMQAWRRLDDSAAATLEQRFPISSSKGSPRFEEANRELLRSIAQLLLAAAPTGGRANHYRRAFRQVQSSTAPWSRHLNPVVASHLQHAALVWISLWHAADAPAVTAKQMEACLRLHTAPQRVPPAARRKRWRIWP
jgi:hypothetical protein